MIPNTRARLLFILTSFMFSAAAGALAQTETATVSGRVTDPSGVIVSGTEIQLQSIERGTAQEATSNAAGIYSFPSVQPGQYHMTVRKVGFRQIEVVGLLVNVQDHVEKNFQLQVGSTSESITVSGGAPLVNTEDATISTVVDRNFAENLPMNGRTFQTLIELAPGVTVTSAANGNDSGQFSVNGQRAASNYWMVDGVSANIGVGVAGPSNGTSGSLGAFSVQGGTNGLVSVDAMQEFRIQTSTYAPEFGRTPGGQISIVTRSGSNNLHGTVFDYVRNDKLDANDWFADHNGLPKPQERQNDFGGTLSGPIKQDRTFFFFSYEGLRLRLPQVSETTVPDLAARQSALPAVQPFLNAFPLPNGPDLGQGVAEFNSSFSNASTLNAYSLRLDHRLSNSINLFGRYNYSPSDFTQRGVGGALSNVSPSRITMQTATIGATWLVSHIVANDFRFNYSRTTGDSSNTLDSFGGATPLTSLPIPLQVSPTSATFGFDIFSLTGGLVITGPNVHNVQRQFNIVDSVSIQAGGHRIKAGVDYRRLSPTYALGAYSQSAFFNDVPSAESGSPAFAVLTSDRDASLLFRNLGAYVQDTWRPFPRLSLTYGLRLDVDFAPAAVNGLNFQAVNNFNINNLSQLSLAGPGTSPFQTQYANVAPRVGAALVLSHRQNWNAVLRGGVGLFYDLATQEAGNLLVTGTYPFGGFSFFTPSVFPLTPSEAAPVPITPPGGGSGQIAAFDPNLQLPYTIQWNLALEQELDADQALSFTYLGAAGRRLVQTTLVSQPNPNYQSAEVVTNSSTSDYDALQVQFKRRLAHHLQAVASYSLAHSIDDASAGSIGNLANTLVPSVNPSINRGPSDFDIRHGLTGALIYAPPSLSYGPIAKVITSQWSIENILQAHSSPPVNVYEPTLTELFNGETQVRPDVVPGIPFYLYGSQYPGGKAINPSAFTLPPVDPTTGEPLRQGDLGRNALRAFSVVQWDFAVHRDFPIRDKATLQFRSEMFNVLNHPNFGPPNSAIGTSEFGVSTQSLADSLAGVNLGGGALTPLYQIGGPRSIQFALKLSF